MTTSGWTDVARTRIRQVQDGLLSMTELARSMNADVATTEMLLEPYRELVESLYERDLQLAKLADNSDLLFHVRGPAASAAAPRVSVVTRLLTSARDQVTGLAKQLGGVESVHVPKALDMGFVGTAPGSLFIGFSAEPDAEGELTRQAVRAIADASQVVAKGGSIDSLVEQIEDPAARDMALAAVRQLSPSGQIGVREIDLLGREVERSISLTTETRREARAIMAQRAPNVHTSTVGCVGTIRELDLDASRFVIRNIESDIGVAALRCVHQLDESDIQALVNSRVRVRGTAEHSKRGAVRLLWVDEIEAL